MSFQRLFKVMNFKFIFEHELSKKIDCFSWGDSELMQASLGFI